MLITLPSGGGAAAGGPGLQPVMRSGLWYPTRPIQSSSTRTNGNATATTASLAVPRALTLATIGLEIATPGSAGSLLRLMLYADDGNGYPGALVVDAGTIDGTLAAGGYEITINQAVAAGLFHHVFAQQGAPATPTTVRSANNPGEVPGFTSITGATQGSNFMGWFANGGFGGAAPNPFPAGATVSSNLHKGTVKVA